MMGKTQRDRTTGSGIEETSDPGRQSSGQTHGAAARHACPGVRGDQTQCDGYGTRESTKYPGGPTPIRPREPDMYPHGKFYMGKIAEE